MTVAPLPSASWVLIVLSSLYRAGVCVCVCMWYRRTRVGVSADGRLPVPAGAECAQVKTENGDQDSRPCIMSSQESCAIQYTQKAINYRGERIAVIFTFPSQNVALSLSLREAGVALVPIYTKI